MHNRYRSLLAVFGLVALSACAPHREPSVLDAERPVYAPTKVELITYKLRDGKELSCSPENNTGIARADSIVSIMSDPKKHVQLIVVDNSRTFTAVTTKDGVIQSAFISLAPSEQSGRAISIKPDGSVKHESAEAEKDVIGEVGRMQSMCTAANTGDARDLYPELKNAIRGKRQPRSVPAYEVKP